MTVWPPLIYNQWQDTLDTLHLWLQIIGKTKLSLCPFLNQWWEVAFYVTSTGMTTGRIPYKNTVFSIDLDFINHSIIIRTDNGAEKIIHLHPMTVADFYSEFMDSLPRFGINVKITSTPSEITNPLPFKSDHTHCSYDKDAVYRWWRIQLQVSIILDQFRTSFRGKSSPVQFFWGSFDLNTTRYSGKILPDKTDWPKGYGFMRYAENEENFSVGFWPGDLRFPAPAFYSYLSPAPPGCESINTGPSISYFNQTLSECILPYEAVRKTKHPEREILSFINTTYAEYAKLAGWDVKELTGPVPPLIF